MKIIVHSCDSVHFEEPTDNKALITICEHDRNEYFKKPWKHILGMNFADVDYLGHFWRKDSPKYYRIFNEIDAHDVYNFIKDLPKSIDTIVVNCAAGLSRSVAVGMFLGYYYNFDLFSAECYRKTFKSASMTVLKILIVNYFGMYFYNDIKEGILRKKYHVFDSPKFWIDCNLNPDDYLTDFT